MMNKTISFFWGNEKMSWLRYMTLWSFSHLNPDWKIRLFICEQQQTERYWTDHNLQDFFAYTGPDYIDELKDVPRLEVIDWEITEKDLLTIGPSHKSNFFKWGLLSKESGVYADMDILFVRPIDDWFVKVRESDVAVCYQKSNPDSLRKIFSIGLLGSSGKGNFYQDVYNECVKGFTTMSYQSAGVMVLYRMFGHVTHQANTHWETMHTKYPNVKFANFEMDYIYPWSSIEHMTSQTHVVPQRTFGIHWYAGSPLSQKMNATMIPETLPMHQNTISHYAKQLLKEYS